MRTAQGTRIPQSLTVLNTYDTIGPLPAHDYLDDIESFFYVLAFIFLVHLPNGARTPSRDEGPSIVRQWDNSDAGVARRQKSWILSGSDTLLAAKVIEKTWCPICASLFTKFSYWMCDTTQQKVSVIEEQCRKEERSEQDEDGDEDDDDDDDEMPEPDRFTLFYSRRDEHYAYFLGLFDAAIDQLSVAGTAPRVAARPTVRATNHAGNTTKGPSVVHPPPPSAPTLRHVSAQGLNHDCPSDTPAVPSPTVHDM